MKDQLTLLISVNETSVSNTYVCQSVCLLVPMCKLDSLLQAKFIKYEVLSETWTTEGNVFQYRGS